MGSNYLSLIEEQYSVKEASLSETVSIHFRFEPVGWAQCTLNYSTCILSVVSDWGSWSYRWGPDDSLTLGARIVSWGPIYVSDKLGALSKDVFSSEMTVESLKEEVIAQRKRGKIGVEEATSRYDRRTRSYWSSSDEFYYSSLAKDLEGVIAFLPDHIRTEPSSSYKVLRALIVPSLISYLKDFNEKERSLRP